MPDRLEEAMREEGYSRRQLARDLARRYPDSKEAESWERKLYAVVRRGKGLRVEEAAQIATVLRRPPDYLLTSEQRVAAIPEPLEELRRELFDIFASLLGRVDSLADQFESLDERLGSLESRLDGQEP